MRRLLAGSLALLAACGAAPPADRLVRAVDAMERLAGVRFTLDATSVATGAAGAEPLALHYHATGELVPPDRLRLVVDDPAPATLVIVGARAWRDGRPMSPAALRTLAQPLAVLEQAREAGPSAFAGLGFARGNLTLRFRVDRADRGTVEVEVGLLDDLIRRQSFVVTEDAPAGGSGLDRVRTTFVVEYWDYGAALAVREPNEGPARLLTEGRQNARREGRHEHETARLAAPRDPPPGGLRPGQRDQLGPGLGRRRRSHRRGPRAAAGPGRRVG